MHSATEQTCTACGVTKQFTQFAKHKGGKNGLRAKCRECANVIRMVRVDATRGHVRELGKIAAAKRRSTPDGMIKNREASNKYYAANQEKAKAAATIYRVLNREKFNATIAEWRRKYPERQRAANAAWNSAHPKQRRIYGQNRRARSSKSNGVLSARLSDKLFLLQKGRCPCCNQPLGVDFHLDHRMPLALGGSNTDDNMQLLRAICNLQKNAKHPIDFMQSRGFLL